MAKRPQLVRGDDWTYRANPAAEVERVRILDLSREERQVEVEFVYRDNEREWVPVARLDSRWDDVPVLERDRIAETWITIGRQESDGELLTMALALLADFMPEEAWRIYKRYHRAASTTEWNVIGAFASMSVRHKLGLPDKAPWPGVRE